ncbi:hypothetical protein JKP88DRAFT_231166 [Tribonema minus]|uniref:Uncharacterized protein n=1 Tax=Tribonema minus TaxID=303371 RepID=A0A835ZEI5_9STRA|nr:hypothetical protein JKP88DRAFT_231166 [Tribonema minus]
MPVAVLSTRWGARLLSCAVRALSRHTVRRVRTCRGHAPAPCRKARRCAPPQRGSAQHSACCAAAACTCCCIRV